MDLKESELQSLENETRHPWELVRMKIVSKMVKELNLQNQNVLRNVLDLGCGDAYLVFQLSKQFPEINFFAVDTGFTKEQLDFYHSRFAESNIKVYQNIDDIHNIAEKMDLVLLLDVVEHIEEDENFLINIQKKNILQHEKVFYIITVPAFQFLFSAHDHFLKHYRRYTNSQLRKLCEKVGLNVLKRGYFFTILLFFRILAKMKESFLKTESNEAKGISNWNGNKTMSSFIAFILTLDYLFSKYLLKIGVRIPGLSTYVICKKSV